MAYLGRGLDKISNIEVLDNITFTNSAGPYNITKDSTAFVPASANALVISIDGVIQSPSSYTLSVATITFDTSMASTSTMNFMYQIGAGVITTPSDGSVGTAQLATDAVTNIKVADDVWISGSIRVAHPSTFVDDVAFSKDVSITDDLHVSGNMRADTLTLSEGPFDHKSGLLSMVASGSAVFEKDVTVDDDLWVSGAIKVSKPSTFDNTLTVAEDGSFSKDLYVADDLWVSGSATLAKLSIASDFYVPDDLWVSGGLEAAHGYIVNRLVVGNGAGDEELRISAGNAATGSLVFSKNNGESGEITFDANENIVVQNNTNNDDIIFKVKKI